MNRDDSTWLNFFYLALAALASYVFFQCLETVGTELALAEKLSNTWHIIHPISSIVLGVATVLYVRLNKERHDFLLSCVNELKKVTWPSVDSTKKMTLVVVVVVAFFVAILFVYDLMWTKIFNMIIRSA